MGYVRKLIKSKTAGLKTFGDACKCFCDLTMGLCRYASRIHYIFDSYHLGSIKDSERQRRSSDGKIEISSVQTDTPIPKDMDSFWPSVDNKVKIEKLLHLYLCTLGPTYTNAEIIISGFYDYEEVVTPCVSLNLGLTQQKAQIYSNLEEASYMF